MTDAPSPGNVRQPEGGFLTQGDAVHHAIRAWILFLQGFFKERPAGQFRWHPSVEMTEILITDQESNVSSTRPRIVTTRAPVRYASTSRSQIMTEHLNSEDKIYADLLSTYVHINVVAREGLEAQKIAYLIFIAIPVFKRSIQRLGRIHSISNGITMSQETAHGQLVPGSSTPEWKSVQVSVPFYIQEVIKAEGEAFYSLLKAVTLNMGSS